MEDLISLSLSEFCQNGARMQVYLSPVVLCLENGDTIRRQFERTEKSHFTSYIPSIVSNLFSLAGKHSLRVRRRKISCVVSSGAHNK